MVQIVNGLLIKGGSLLMAHRSKHRTRYPNCWSFPGGGVEPEESLEQALIRELGEEVGVVPREFEYLGEIIDGEISFHIFCVVKWTGDIANRGDEHDELRWVNFHQAASMDNLALEQYQALFDRLISGQISEA